MNINPSILHSFIYFFA